MMRRLGRDTFTSPHGFLSTSDRAQGTPRGLWCRHASCFQLCLSVAPIWKGLFCGRLSTLRYFHTISPVTRETTRSSFPMFFLASHETMQETQTLTWPRAHNYVPTLQCLLTLTAHSPNLLNNRLSTFIWTKYCPSCRVRVHALRHTACLRYALYASQPQQAWSWPFCPLLQLFPHADTTLSSCDSYFYSF